MVEALDREPASVPELAERLGVHHTSVRKHLAGLVRAGVVVASTDAPSGRGRPLTRYRLAPDTSGVEAEGHRELVRLLVRLVSTMGLGPDEMEGFGEGQGAAMAEPGEGVQALTRAFQRLGFAPAEIDGDWPRDLVLGHCPFAPGVEAEGGELICVLHRGLAKGILNRAAPDVRLARLIEEEPRKAGCRVCLEPVAAAGEPARS